MVIYLKKRRMLLKRFLFFIFFFIFLLGFNYVVSYLKYNDRDVVTYSVLIEQNKILKKELEELSDLEIDSESYIIGKVLFRDMYNFYEEIVINLGSDKVDIGDAVVGSDGLIGVVYKVNKNTANVKLLSSDYNVSVVVGDTYGNLNNGIISMLDKYSDIKEGDLVYTSGFSEVEKGIYVGKVKKVFLDNEGLGKEVEVELADNKNLNYIGVIKRIK